MHKIAHIMCHVDLSYPLHTLINISKSALGALLSSPHSAQQLVTNGQQLLRRVYPCRTRILSGNLDPLKCWGVGSHFAVLNWQDFDRGMQLNEAMFWGMPGWVVKPAFLRGEAKPHGKIRVAVHIRSPGEDGESGPIPGHA